MPYEVGSRSRETALFMLDGDVNGFDDELSARTGERACWWTGQHRLARHESLLSALEHDGVQAFLGLRDDDGGPTGPVIQYLPTDFAVSAFGRSISRNDPNAVIRAGRLAFMWFPEEEPPETRERFTELARVAWQAVSASSSAHLVTETGRPRRNARIGVSAKRWALDHPDQPLLEVNRPLRIRAGS